MGLFGKKNKLVLHLTDADMVRLMRIRSLYSYQLSKEVDDLFVITKAIQKEEAELDERYSKVLNDPVKNYNEFYKPTEEKGSSLVDVTPTKNLEPTNLDNTAELQFDTLPNYFTRQKEEEFPENPEEI